VSEESSSGEDWRDSSVDNLISLGSFVATSNDQVCCNLEGQIAILNLADRTYYGLDEVGAAIWEMLAEPRCVSEIRDELLRRYQVEPDRCTEDLICLLDALLTRGLIRVIGEAEK
jgi:Coenzyme PQQ synthesis protein D (PqqD)